MHFVIAHSCVFAFCLFSSIFKYVDYYYTQYLFLFKKKILGLETPKSMKF